MLTSQEAAKFLGVSSDAIRMAAFRGRLKPVKRGRDLFYELSDLQDYAATKPKTGRIRKK